MEQNEYGRQEEEMRPPERKRADRSFLKGAVAGAAAVLIAAVCIFGGSALLRNILTGVMRPGVCRKAMWIGN